MNALTFELTFIVIECPLAGCGVSFAIEEGFQSRRRDDHALFYCPNGHRMNYSGDNEAQLLRKENQRLSKLQANERENTQFWREQSRAADRRSAAARGQVTKMRNRIANGVCPVPGCKRSGFDDVAQHIATVHPTFHAHEGTS